MMSRNEERAFLQEQSDRLGRVHKQYLDAAQDAITPEQKRRLLERADHYGMIVMHLGELMLG